LVALIGNHVGWATKDHTGARDRIASRVPDNPERVNRENSLAELLCRLKIGVAARGVSFRLIGEPTVF
jgi:hypothetical protein